MGPNFQVHCVRRVNSPGAAHGNFFNSFVLNRVNLREEADGIVLMRMRPIINHGPQHLKTTSGRSDTYIYTAFLPARLSFSRRSEQLAANMIVDPLALTCQTQLTWIRWMSLRVRGVGGGVLMIVGAIAIDPRMGGGDTRLSVSIIDHVCVPGGRSSVPTGVIADGQSLHYVLPRVLAQKVFPTLRNPCQLAGHGQPMNTSFDVLSAFFYHSAWLQ